MLERLYYAGRSATDNVTLLQSDLPHPYQMDTHRPKEKEKICKNKYKTQINSTYAFIHNLNNRLY